MGIEVLICSKVSLISWRTGNEPPVLKIAFRGILQLGSVSHRFLRLKLHMSGKFHAGIKFCTIDVQNCINRPNYIVKSHLNYCCFVWGSCRTTKLNKLQKFKNRASRIVRNSDFDTSAALLVEELGWSTVETTIHRETSTMAFKCLNILALEYSVCFSKLSDCHNRGLHNSKPDLLLPLMRTSYRQKSFAYRGAKVWNELDLESKLAPSIHCCKARLKTNKGV